MGETTTPFKNIGDLKTLDRRASDFENSDLKVAKIKRFVNKGEYDEDVVRYTPGALNLMFQRMVKNVTARQQPVDSRYTDIQNLKFRPKLTQNHFTDSNTSHLCFPIKIKTNVNTDIDNNMITVNNFFAHWIKKINVTRYGDDVQIPPTRLSYEIYQYSDTMLKQL